MIAALNELLTPSEIRLIRHLADGFRLAPDSVHGPVHWLTVLRNGLHLASHHPCEVAVVRLFALIHDSCRYDEWSDPGHGPRAADLAEKLHADGCYHLSSPQLALLLTACRIHNGAGPQSDPTLGVCLDADRLDLGRVGITPDPALLSTGLAKDIASRWAWDELGEPVV